MSIEDDQDFDMGVLAKDDDFIKRSNLFMNKEAFDMWLEASWGKIAQRKFYETGHPLIDINGIQCGCVIDDDVSHKLITITYKVNVEMRVDRSTVRSGWDIRKEWGAYIDKRYP